MNALTLTPEVAERRRRATLRAQIAMCDVMLAGGMVAHPEKIKAFQAAKRRDLEAYCSHGVRRGEPCRSCEAVMSRYTG